MDHIKERIEYNHNELTNIKENKISINSCGAGWCYGALDELNYLRQFLDELEKENSHVETKV
jgi:hypothetical protein